LNHVYRDWLLSESGQAALEQLTELPRDAQPTAGQAGDWTREQAQMLTDMLELRQRAAAKLENPQLWWLTQRGLEQASGTLVARYKAEAYFRRETQNERVFDICSGIGGDLMELARTGHVVSVDQDPRLIELQKLTAKALGLESRIRFVNDALKIKQVPPEGMWHLDPDRRWGDKKTVQPLCFSPALAEIEQLVHRAPNGIVKLAPATIVPDDWDCSREWIGAQGECKQQLALFGRFAVSGLESLNNELDLGDTAIGHREHRVTLVKNTGEWHSFQGSPDVMPQFRKEMPEPGEWLYEPQAAFFAAGIVPALSQSLGLQQVSARCGYLIGEGDGQTNPLTSCFRIEAVSSLDSKKLRKLMRELDVGRIEIKKRGVPADWLSPLAKLKPEGTRPMTLLVFPLGKRIKVVLATRLSAQP
jgi:hypothetical protein